MNTSKHRVRVLQEDVDVEEAPLIGDAEVSASQDDDMKPTKTSYAMKTICYAAAVSVLMTIFCFGLSQTFGIGDGAARNDRPIELEVFFHFLSSPQSQVHYSYASCLKYVRRLKQVSIPCTVQNRI